MSILKEKSIFKVGDKVTPISKSVISDLSQSTVWKRAQEEGQDFLYVSDIVDKDCLFSPEREKLSEGELVYTLHEDEVNFSGDYFLAKDLVAYEKEEVKKEKIRNYNIGDKVLLRSDLESGKHYILNDNSERDVLCVSSMVENAGEVMTIDEYVGKDGCIGYKLKEGLSSPTYTDDMIEGKIIPIELDPFESNYKVGDKVLIRTDLKYGNYYEANCDDKNDVYFASSMGKYRGTIVTIKEVQDGAYDVEETDMWVFSDGMIEGQFIPSEDVAPSLTKEVEYVEEKVKTKVEIIDCMEQIGLVVRKVIYNSPATIMFYETKSGKSRKVVSICQGEDKFSEEKGYNICLVKAFQRTLDKELKNLYKLEI